jgi:1,2-phenylacetyl-CoA epoxidase catalytic subunit
MSEEQVELAKPYHQAILHWQKHNFPDYPLLFEKWETFFPTDSPFCLCAKFAEGVSEVMEVGEKKGQPKALDPRQLEPETAQHLLAIIRAQASTEFGSIQQHQATFQRAPEDLDKAWVLRVMAEEFRHGYQMVYLLTSQDWSAVTDTRPEEMVDEILSMQTGSHVLAAFNLEYDSFIDNVVFCAFIDRVGKYQLTMQKVCAYKPYAASMPPMLKEEAFHLASGVMPLRRWVERAAKGDPYITMNAIQRAVAKWFGRGLEMFGIESGGQNIVRMGIKDLTNAEAIDAYAKECDQMLRDLNRRYVRARVPETMPDDVDVIVERLLAGDGADGIVAEDMLRLPDRRFFRRRGVPAYQMIGFNGQSYTDVDAYVKHLAAALPEPYMVSHDVRHYVNNLRNVIAGKLTIKDAVKNTPHLERVGGKCPCSNSVRWVMGLDA